MTAEQVLLKANARTGARSSAEVLDWTRATVEPRLRTVINRLPGSLQKMAAYHFGWTDEHGTAVPAMGGKALRPALCLLCAAAFAEPGELAVSAAVAVELVHNFSLVHDDVMDVDRLRRHRPTVWVVFGTGSAILAGDALLTLALDALGGWTAGERQLRLAVMDLIEAQDQDLDFESRDDVGLEECLRMARGKTAALFSCATALGALSGGAGVEQVRAMAEFGERVGMAFQLTDDLLGIWGEKEFTGKPERSDLRRSKKSVPVVAAMASATPAGAELSKLYRRSPSGLSDRDADRAALLIEATGARQWTTEYADHLLDDALKALDSAEADPRVAAELVQVVGAIARRRA